MNLRALLELMRVSNLPTVWSNVWLGWLAGIVVLNRTQFDKSFNDLREGAIEVFFSILGQASLAAISISLLYVGGMILNDFCDRVIDAQERPSRPIPSGRIRARDALILAIGCLGLGFTGMAWVEFRYHWITHEAWRTTLFTAVLVVVIVRYNLVHAQSASSVLLMGACRGLIIFSCASIKAPPLNDPNWWLFVFGPAITLILYTLVISIVARREVEPGGFGGPKVVMNMIAAMPLLDAAWLVAMGLWPASLVCVGCSVLTKLGHRKVAGS